MKIFNHRGTENTEGLYALSLPNLEAISDYFTKLMTKKLKAFILKMGLGELEVDRLLSKKMSYLMGRAIEANNHTENEPHRDLCAGFKNRLCTSLWKPRRWLS